MKLDLNTVHCLDCLSGLSQLPDACVDLAFADPPFNIGYEYDVYRDTLDDEAYLNWCRQWTGEVARVLKPDGTFWLAIGDEYVAELKTMIQREHHLVLRSWVIWYYTFGTYHDDRFARSHTHLLYWVKNPKRFTFHGDAIRVPSARQSVYRDKRARPQGRIPDNTWILRPQDLPQSGDWVNDTWYVPRICGTFKERQRWHPCQMPELILERIILACSNPGDLVLDPFAGSGTTLVVAKRHGRQFLGFELSANYVSGIKERLALTPQSG